jgi:phosphatidylglycerol---prolipoprotein diacylglyceryl transferase
LNLAIPVEKNSRWLALGGLASYDPGRFWLEPLREAPDLVFGRVRINEVIAACLTLAAVGGLFLLNLTSI